MATVSTEPGVVVFTTSILKSNLSHTAAATLMNASARELTDPDGGVSSSFSHLSNMAAWGEFQLVRTSFSSVNREVLRGVAM